jgi:hypothetical protein
MFYRNLRGATIPPPLLLSALIDTGAQVSCVEPAAVTSLNLPTLASASVNAPGMGGHLTGKFLDAGLTIIHPSGNSTLDLRIPDITLLELPIGSRGYEVLIGRDVLASCDLLYRGRSGNFTLTY